ncbi:helix-turn-helix domain-containing protein [Methylobacterium nodulans]|uniref:Transcriptional regulator, XRE family n=1 Tax=Methylobacterium nodulans (strain LMG 21967 / CNCM I-2342 / ORS 2060) TaxID=460265 RepID=B8INW8_METNO|nr:helix-turn-helix transcriptional regulator [Methylobacterium nodulans]ACL58484.1 transcriptional regulator, XRE family [Methylobacterium nodulans ORS 2060]
MKLAAYLADREIKDSDFAARIGVTRQTLWRYKSGERRPEWDVLERISRATDGQVTPNDFLSDAPTVPSLPIPTMAEAAP